MSCFSGKQNVRDWLSLGCGKEEAKESPRLAALQRMRAKRAAVNARAGGAAEQEEEFQQGDQRPSKSRKTLVEVQQDQPTQPTPLHATPLRLKSENPSLVLAPQQPSSSPSLALAPPPSLPPLPSPRLPFSTLLRMRRPTITLQLFPEKDTPLYKSNIVGVRRAWVTRADGERMSGLLRWSETVDDIIITCDCHNLMLRPEGFLNHAGLKGISMDRPLRHIIVSTDPLSQE